MAEAPPKKTLVLSRSLGSGRRVLDVGQVRQSFSHGRSKTVTVEVKRKRTLSSNTPSVAKELSSEDSARPLGLTDQEWEMRLRVVKEAMRDADALEERKSKEAELYALAEKNCQEDAPHSQQDAQLEGEKAREEVEALAGIPPLPSTSLPPGKGGYRSVTSKESGDEKGERKNKKSFSPVKRSIRPEADKRRTKISINAALNEQEERLRSQASLWRARRKSRLQQAQDVEQTRQVRDVVIPEAISVQELANRMAVRAAEVLKILMRLGVTTTINQTLDADTAELLVGEFGHNVRRVSESDVELGLKGEPDTATDFLPRPPVVTIMGHVDHGNTSLLDAIRRTDVALREAGGITQHIGAYQITLKDGRRITFIDTPGHAAFTEMRARGANVTDIVVLVVAADDGIKEQTVEAIHHAKAANVPIIVAINKIDKPGANADRVRQELLGHEIVVEAFGGDVLDVEVSAKTEHNLDKLAEAILMQAEILDLKSNPNRTAEGIIIESEVRQGLGPVATILVQRGRLCPGDIFVSGVVSGRVRSLLNDCRQKLTVVEPGTPAEVTGFNAAPSPGDELVVVADEARAKEIAQFRERKQRERASALKARGSVEQMFAKISSDEKLQMLSAVVKADVQGSAEAICNSLAKLSNDEVCVRILHSGIGSITESDIALARTSRAIVIGFNVRANPQAREMAQREGIELCYYSIVYDLIDAMKARLSGLLAPEQREKILGTAEIRQIFEAKKTGKIAGCIVAEGCIRRGAKVRLFREGTIAHEGYVRSLRRIREEVSEVAKGFECGMTLTDCQDIREGDIIECFEVEEIARRLA
ncbi:MAG: translation initiation factor IF-2 [Holosporales bacterium]|jgi:translation initiation factor IF-2|nr:translation initiation factor IF-2 [Holosporales bacterium]